VSIAVASLRIGLTGVVPELAAYFVLVCIKNQSVVQSVKFIAALVLQALAT